MQPGPPQGGGGYPPPPNQQGGGGYPPPPNQQGYQQQAAPPPQVLRGIERVKERSCIVGDNSPAWRDGDKASRGGDNSPASAFFIISPVSVFYLLIFIDNNINIHNNKNKNNAGPPPIGIPAITIAARGTTTWGCPSWRLFPQYVQPPRRCR